MRVRGKVTRWLRDRGFGFIRADDGRANIFCHVSDAGGNHLLAGAAVEFDLEDTERGLRAFDLHVITGGS